MALRALASGNARHGRECPRRAAAFNAVRRTLEKICYVKAPGRPGFGAGPAP
jgi:hypothetical protein